MSFIAFIFKPYLRNVCRGGYEHSLFFVLIKKVILSEAFILIIRNVTNREVALYRVSINSFPDYKHLLQENYCTWNTNTFF